MRSEHWSCRMDRMTAYVAALLPDKLREAAVLIIFAFTLCCYVQTMFLNGKMQVLVGQEIAWGKRTILPNLLLWIAVFAKKLF